MYSFRYSILIFVFILFSIAIFSQNKNFNVYNANFIHSNYSDKNNIKMSFTNKGTSQSGISSDGGFWELENEFYRRNMIYDIGPWIIGKKNNAIVLSGAQWQGAYSQGPIINGQAAMLIHPEDSIKYRVYKINKGDDDSNPDYAEWPIDFGAPINELGEPLILGDQTLWTCYNYLDATLKYPFYPFPSIDPLEIEIHQTVFARKGNHMDNKDIFSNVIFIEYEIIYKGSEPIDSTYFGFWTDIDFDPFLPNIPAIDTSLQLGYCWTSEDTTWEGELPISVGFSSLYGPVISEIGATAKFKGRDLFNYKNQEINSFRGIGEITLPLNDSLYLPILSVLDGWNYANGRNRNGNKYYNQLTGSYTSFPFSGDPVTGNGWLAEKIMCGFEAGVMLFNGPFTLAPNDTQWTMLALVPGLGNSNLNSITVMREKVKILRSLPYDSLAFGITPYFITDVVDAETLPNNFLLSQNYPNPFNPTTKISWQLPTASFVTLKIYNSLGEEVDTIVNEFMDAGTHSKLYIVNSKLSSGVYFYQLKAGDFLQTKKMIVLK